MLTAGFLGAGVFLSAFNFAQQDDYLEPVVKSATEITNSAAKSQQKINQITEQIDDKLQQFKTINIEIDGLEIYNNQLRKQLVNQQQEMLNLNDSIDEVSVIERQITPFMIRMIEGVEQFVALDAPFLVEERANGIANLKLMMDRADIAPSEKFRRVMEAF
ncbi:MAG: hypothetical protein ACI808_002387 [Paraglaciecola sp.]|jgi:hypothetical protein